MDFTFMRTGRQLAEPEPTAAEDSEMKAAILVFMEEALALAVRYASYKGVEEVEPQHLVACLKVHAQRGTTGLCGIPDVDARLAEYADLLECSESDQEDDEDEDDDHPHVFDQLSDSDMAAVVEFAESRWDAWAPQNPTEQVLKQAIERTAAQFLA